MAGKGISLRQDWYCPFCPKTVTTFVTMTRPPSHACYKKAKRTIPLTRKVKPNEHNHD